MHVIVASSLDNISLHMLHTYMSLIFDDNFTVSEYCEEDYNHSSNWNFKLIANHCIVLLLFHCKHFWTPMSNFVIFFLVVVGCILNSNALLGVNPITSNRVNNQKRLQPLNDVPLELTGKLDSSKSWDVKFIFQGKEKIVKIKEDTSFLECGEKIFDNIPSSCRNGVCTTCAGKVNWRMDRAFRFWLIVNLHHYDV